MAQATRNLILINTPGWQARQDFEEIGAKINAFAPEIDVQIVAADQSTEDCDSEFWQRPCLTVSFDSQAKFRPKRGRVYCNRFVSKLEQLRRLHRANIPIPLSAPLVFGKQLDPRMWGPLVVLKPTAPGFMSQGSVSLVRTQRVVELAELIFPRGHPARKFPILVQRFVDTGPWPCSYRVLTLFGEPLYCRHGFGSEPRPLLDAQDEVLLRAKIATNAESPTRRQHYFSNETDVLVLARRAYAAMPGIPLQGVDIIREAGSGHLFVLEINPGGNTWHFSSTLMEERRKARAPGEQAPSITREDRIRQFGAWDVAARVLVDKTLEEAR